MHALYTHPLCAARVHPRHTAPRIVTCNAVQSTPSRQLTLSYVQVPIHTANILHAPHLHTYHRVKGLPQGTASSQASQVLVSTLSQVPDVANVQVVGDQVTITTTRAVDAAAISTLLQHIRNVVRVVIVLHMAFYSLVCNPSHDHHMTITFAYPLSSPLYPQDTKYLALPYAEKTWQWQGHRISYAEAGPPHAPPVVMVHGFGASAGHFRKLIQFLSLEYHVFAVDLLGK